MTAHPVSQPGDAARPDGAAVLAVLAGGALGTSARLALDALLPHPDAGWAWSTLLANVLGSLLLGALASALWPMAATWLRAGLGVGVLGSFTTFSAVAVSAVAMTDAGAGPLALAYVALSMTLGLAAAALGLLMGRGLASRRRPSPGPDADAGAEAGR